MATKTVTVWHFAADTLRDGSPLPEKGAKLPRIVKPILCERGWHGSVRAMDALRFARGCNVARRVLSGTIKRGEDKACSSEARMATEYRNAGWTLVAFADWCAVRAKEHAAAARSIADTAYVAAYAPADVADAARAIVAADNADDAAESAAAAASYAAADVTYAAPDAAYAAADSAAAAARYAARYGSISTPAAYYAAAAARYAADAASAAADAARRADSSYAAVREAQNAKLERLLSTLFD